MCDTKTTGVGGNTKPPPTDSQSRNWFITLNNYTEVEYETMRLYFLKAKTYILCKEIGEEKKVPHLHAYGWFKNNIRFSTMKKKFPRANIQTAKGTQDQAYEYCIKSGDYISNIVPKTPKLSFRQEMINLVLEQEYKDVVWRPFQQEILDLINGPVNPRAINWFWESTGNIGKSYLCKYLCMKYDIVMCVGSRDNILNQVLELYKQKKYPKIVIMDIPRSSLGLISYQAIEMVKGGCIYSGKYEGGIAIYPRPHVICLSNEKPDESMMSADVWNVQQIVVE